MRKLLGIDRHKYTVFGMFRKKVLDIAMKEINELTTLNVSYDLEKIGRKWGAVVFHISGVIEETPKSEIMEQIMQKLEYYGFQKKQINRLLKIHNEEYLMANIGVIEEQLEQGKSIKNVRAYMSKAFQVDFRKTETEYDKSLAKKQQTNEKEAEEQKQKELAETKLKATFKEEKNRKLVEVKAKFSDAELSTLRAEFEEELLSNEFFEKIYKTKGFNFGAIQSKRDKFLSTKFLASEYQDFENYRRSNN